MTGPTLVGTFVLAEEKYRLLLREAEGLLAHLDAYSAEELGFAVARREGLVGELKGLAAEIDRLLADRGGALAPGEADRLAEFRSLQEGVTGRIRELDALVMAFAGERLAALQDELEAIARGRNALRGYQQKDRERPHGISNSA